MHTAFKLAQKIWGNYPVIKLEYYPDLNRHTIEIKQKSLGEYYQADYENSHLIFEFAHRQQHVT